MSGDLWDEPPSIHGSVQDLSGDPGDDARPLAVLWLPDIEKPHGWCNHVVYPKPSDPPERRPLGWK